MTHSAIFVRISSCSVAFIIRTLLVAAAVLAGGVTGALAQTGTISGTVTSSTTGLGLPNGEVHFYDLIGNTGFERRIAPTNGLGQYTIDLPAGTYGILTQNKQGYINEIYDNVQCSAVCDSASLTPVIVTNGSVFVANFALDPGGRIAGRVTNSTTGQGIAGVRLYFVPSTGDVPFSFATTDANGDYISDAGTVAGTVFAAAFAPGYRGELWDDIKCADCDPTQGTPIVVAGTGTTGGIDFALDPGGTISGTVRDANLAPLAGVEISILDSTGQTVEFGITDASGNYTSGGLLTGSYYVMTNQNPFGLVDQVWNGIPCPNGYCNPTLAGTLVSVTLLIDTPGINFTLSAGGLISGTVTSAATGQHIQDNIFVQLYDAAGQFVGGAHTDKDTGVYYVRGVPPGTYYAIVGYTGFFNQLYNGINCQGFCPPTQGAPIHVAVGADTTNINFALVPTTSVGSISGTVTDTSTGQPVTVNQQVQLLSITGQVVMSVNTVTPGGTYTFSNVAVGSYYVRTNFGNQLINMLHAVPSDVVCLNCNVFTSGGTPVPVTAGNTTTINFALSPGGRISGVITNAVGGAAIQNIQVQVFNSSGTNLGQFNSNASGQYTTRGLPDGTYYIRTNNTQGFVDKLYDNLFCPGPGCAVVSGTPVVIAGTATVSNRNFVLSQGGRISGNVTGPNPSQTLQGSVQVQVYTEAGLLLGNNQLDASQNYLTFALPAGRYYLRTTNALGIIDEVYDNLPCPASCSITSGTPVDVTAGATTGGRNFTLTGGGNIAGTVRDASTNALLGSIRVFAYLADGTAVKGVFTNANGEYSIVGLPAGTYYVKTSVAGAGVFYQDELYPEIPCPLTCTLTNGTPVVVTPGVTQGGKNFTLTAGGGALSGTVRDAATGGVLSGIVVQVHLADGTMVKQGATTGIGTYTISLPAGTYYLRTMVSAAGGYLDELYNELPCTPNCNVGTGAPVTVVNSATQGGLDFTLAPNLVRNGRFEGGTSSWSVFGTPDNTYISWQITNGVFEYYRVAPPPGTSNQAVIFQETGIALPSGAPLVARFSLGNSSSVRKRMSVLILDSDFSDLHVCTFWLPAGMPLTPYRITTHTTKAWANAAIYFYAANPNSNGGFYQLDNISMEHNPSESSAETNCVDPTAPAAQALPPSADMLVNGGFDGGVIQPWGTVGNIQFQLSGGVFEFIKLPGLPAGVVLQVTGQAIPANTILTATFQLGNSSPVRKRVTVLLHDNDFSDLAACTFWLPPGQALSNYTFRSFTTKAWTSAALSVYPSTASPDQWIRLDNVSFRRTPNTVIVGTECVEPGGTEPPMSAGSAVGVAGVTGTSGQAWVAPPAGDGPQSLQLSTPLDLTTAASATLAFRSWMMSASAWGEVQVRGADGAWTTLRIISESEDWTRIDVDLSDYLGQVVDVRLVFYDTSGAPGRWRVSEIAIRK